MDKDVLKAEMRRFFNVLEKHGVPKADSGCYIVSAMKLSGFSETDVNNVLADAFAFNAKTSDLLEITGDPGTYFATMIALSWTIYAMKTGV